jgi:hypothetical protein
MIDFKFVVPIRPFEQYNNNIEHVETPYGTKFYCLNYLCAHYYETQNSKYTSNLLNYSNISSNNVVNDPYVFKNILNGKYPDIKIDEEAYNYTIDDSIVPYLFV